MSRSVQKNQKGLKEEDLCVNGVCMSNDREWTKFCEKHQKEIDKDTARWEYYRRTGIDLDVNEEVPK
jgi:hypothetical protein